MATTPARRPVSSPRELTRIGDRVSFLYLERCTIHREDNAITATDESGVRYIPSATIGVLLLGPGTRVTHQAMSVLGESGAGVVWVGEQGVRYYAGGRALTRSAGLVEAQATAWANRRHRLDVAREMYRLRFPDADPAGMTRRELLGGEGTRVKEVYRAEAARTGVRWVRRTYDPGDFAAGDAPNQAVTAAAQCLYGVAHSVVVALGCSPSLGFVHSGHERSFVLDVADLYKVEFGIPAAFDAAAEGPEDVAGRTRRALRERIRAGRLLERVVADVRGLLAPYRQAGAGEAGEAREADGPDGPDAPEEDVVLLHDDHDGMLVGGRNHGAEAVR
ncbi:type I-E CRISPR-associated endonuclease Cas1e [Streptomyces sp. NRRL S-495]|uniref:type I-E CRISPR-associated endonuclease Cas1e n=1 Tax=Streptomyces sp. NRRL S-495 TaxID=1609133 RepID=UPI0005F8F50F|nr:type I-E CRISPR-associated endonuclease Cas1e [Streptomyces sp. NRRL S-495]KJY32583.1 CRISPR-associated protein Cse1 [Streptomyces sp. NRRL S-495]